MTFENVFNDVHGIDSLWGKIKKITATKTASTILNNSFDTEKIKSDGFKKEFYTTKINELKTNRYLAEAITILYDFNEINNWPIMTFWISFIQKWN
jgi:carboxyl-terminal processing protease